VTTNHPERQDRPQPPAYPSAGGTMRASDTDRHQVADVLSAAYAEGRLTRDEHDERLEQAMTAKTFDELVPLTQDLVYTGPPPTAPTPSTAGSQHAMVDTHGADPAPERMIGILGGTSRKGYWRMRKQTQIVAMMGGVELDLREAVLEAHEVEINGFYCMGGVEIIVPEGMNVRNEVVGIMGGADVKIGEPDPNAPVLVIKGVALMGGIEVKTKPPRKDKKKHRHHRHQSY
jgi:hypothetical protein